MGDNTLEKPADEELDSLTEEIILEEGPKEKTELYNSLKDRSYDPPETAINRTLSDHKYERIRWYEIMKRYNILAL